MSEKSRNKWKLCWQCNWLVESHLDGRRRFACDKYQQMFLPEISPKWIGEDCWDEKVSSSSGAESDVGLDTALVLGEAGEQVS